MGDARAALAAAAARFGFSDTARLDAELLLAHVLGVERQRMLLTLDDVTVPSCFEALVVRRVAQEPVAYITGTRGFWTIDLAVGPGALVPRADSETLIEAAIESFVERAPRTVLDLGTGPGTLLLAALDQWPDAQGLGIDRSATALAYARANAVPLGGRASFVQGDWADAIDTRFDLVLANPPYIALGDCLPREVRDHEPAGALFAGEDGLSSYRVLIPQLPRLVNPGGVVVVEIGATQAGQVSAILRANAMDAVTRRDAGGRPRALVITLQ